MGNQSKTFPGILQVSDKIAARASQVNSCRRQYSFHGVFLSAGREDSMVQLRPVQAMWICFLVLRCLCGTSIEEWVGLE